MSTCKNIVITGAARGIGRVTARHLASLDHNIFLIDINEPELIYTATEHIPKILAEQQQQQQQHPPGGLIGYMACDLRDPAAITSTIQHAATFFPGGEIDVLINNAGIARARFQEKRTMEDPAVLDDWMAYLSTNLTAPFLVSQACIPFMKTRAGEQPSQADEASRCIINISSFRAKQSEPNCEGYAASKAGILGLTQAMSISGAQWGIRCNTILPGFTFVDHECREADEAPEKMWWTKGIDGARHRHHPVGRIGYGEDVAEAIVWLISAGFVTGQEIVIDGGVNKVKHASA
ncbi:short chain alcohol dehydrogenase [Cryphonectria parasitica EP155]|uniref:Short chain alcohol dehydrogenase n=1 Tax=Cryphonectria parasitica (strain ATCC 38755 / EP155) TaxID=660469 RepID=A0A9P4XUC7_CRYP1|nr:short chain alcohol dehydrogenase [Cryphonectria parasitica EP155]KAF3760947.1 short chain alcohol dehydrogenase [Cryphonectria parasitica EP155]